MANHAADNLTYYLWIEAFNETHLGPIRTWNNLKLGHDERGIWVKGFDYTQMESNEVKMIPEKKQFYEKDGRLFPVGSLLPHGTVPALNWTPIDRAIPVKLPAINFNFFGIEGQVAVRLKPADTEMPASALLVDLDELEAYLTKAPAVRTKTLDWVLLSSYQAFVFGTPLLPLNGQAFWQSGNSYYPAGMMLEFPLLESELPELVQVHFPDKLLWLPTGEYLEIKYTDFQPLTRASVRKNLIKGSF